MGEVGRMRSAETHKRRCVARIRLSFRSSAPPLSQTLSAPEGQRGLRERVANIILYRPLKYGRNRPRSASLARMATKSRPCSTSTLASGRSRRGAPCGTSMDSR